MAIQMTCWVTMRAFKFARLRPLDRRWPLPREDPGRCLLQLKKTGKSQNLLRKPSLVLFSNIYAFLAWQCCNHRTKELSLEHKLLQNHKSPLEQIGIPTFRKLKNQNFDLHTTDKMYFDGEEIKSALERWDGCNPQPTGEEKRLQHHKQKASSASRKFATHGILSLPCLFI